MKWRRTDEEPPMRNLYNVRSNREAILDQHLQEVRQRTRRRNRHPLGPGQERPHRPRDGAGQRERPQPSDLRRPCRDRRRLGQRSELHRPDLRQPHRRRGRQGLLPHLVPPQPPQRRLTRPPLANREGREWARPWVDINVPAIVSARATAGRDRDLTLADVRSRG